MNHFFRYRFPAILWAIAIYIASSIPGYKIPHFVHQINDKVIHVGLYFVLGILVYLALEPRTKSTVFDWKRLMFSVLAVVVYGITDELHQAFVPGRTVDILDATADTAGGILSALVVYVGHRSRKADP